MEPAAASASAASAESASIPLLFRPMDDITSSREAFQLSQYWVSVFHVLQKMQKSKDTSADTNQLDQQMDRIRVYVDQLNLKKNECRDREHKAEKKRKRDEQKANDDWLAEQSILFQQVKNEHDAYKQQCQAEEDQIKGKMAEMEQQYLRSLRPLHKKLMQIHDKKEASQSQYEKSCPCHLGEEYREWNTPCPTCGSIYTRSCSM